MFKKLYAALLVLALAVSVCACGGKPPGEQPGETDSKTYAFFKKNFINDRYYIKMHGVEDMGDGPQDVTAVSAKSGGRYYFEVEIEGYRQSTVVKDGKIYTILHEEQAYTVSPDDGTYSSDNEFDIDRIKNSPYEKSEREIDGKAYYCEEYPINDSSFATYCFDGEDLKYLIMSGGEKSTQMAILETGSQVSDDLFEIPEGYSGISE